MSAASGSADFASVFSPAHATIATAHRMRAARLGAVPFQRTALVFTMGAVPLARSGTSRESLARRAQCWLIRIALGHRRDLLPQHAGVALSAQAIERDRKLIVRA